MTDQPVLIVFIGVSGSGKSTVGRAFAEACELPFSDADDFHSTSAKRKMASGIALQDTDRLPWLARIHAHLAEYFARGQSCVLAYSGLKSQHRQGFRELGVPIQFFWLKADYGQLFGRLEHRSVHFFPSALLTSQFDAFEPPFKEPDITVLNAMASQSNLIEQCRKMLNETFPVFCD